MIRNDWVRRKNQISASYVNMLRQAKSHIVILCSYFLPGHIFRKHLKDAAARGVRITVITAGRSDVRLAKYAERYMYDWLLRYNVELYEYRHTVLHGKIAVCDNQWLTAGSYNLNDISTYASIELNLNVRNEAFAQRATGMLLEIAMKDCERISIDSYKRSKNFVKQFSHWLSYRLFRLAFHLTTFYYKHKS
jgi:cardiolipin synthase